METLGPVKGVILRACRERTYGKEHGNDYSICGVSSHGFGRECRGRFEINS